MGKKMLEEFEDSDFNGEAFMAYKVTEKGMNWLLENTAEFSLVNESRGEPEIPF